MNKLNEAKHALDTAISELEVALDGVKDRAEELNALRAARSEDAAMIEEALSELRALV